MRSPSSSAGARPDVVVAPLASGSLYTKLARAFGELVHVGLIDEAPIRFVGGQAAGCGPIASAFADGADVVTPVERPDTIVRSLAIGSPADGPYALKLARKSGGSIHGVSDAETVDSIRLLARTEGILTETAGGVTLAALRRAIAAGTVAATTRWSWSSRATASRRWRCWTTAPRCRSRSRRPTRRSSPGGSRAAEASSSAEAS